jgi:hypothetical protein
MALFAKTRRFFRLWLGSHRSRRRNFQSLARLSDWFLRAGSPKEIQDDFKIDSFKKEILAYLEKKPDGWNSLEPFLTAREPEKSLLSLTALAQDGLIAIRPRKNLVKLNDSGRFLLVLRAAEALGPEGANDAENS